MEVPEVWYSSVIEETLTGRNWAEREEKQDSIHLSMVLSKRNRRQDPKEDRIVEKRHVEGNHYPN